MGSQVSLSAPPRALEALPPLLPAPVSRPGLPPRRSEAAARERDRVQIGTIEVNVVPNPPVAPRPAPVPKAAPTGPLARGFTSSFGLRQG